MNLVVGATGLLGQEICRQLRAVGQPVQALVRTTSDPVKVEHLVKLGVLPVYGDLKEQGSLAKACRNVTAVISTASCTFSRQAGDNIATVDQDGQLALVEAAKATGVKHFVFISFPDLADIQYPLTRAKRAVERRLRESGMVYTSLQANFFIEVWLSAAWGLTMPTQLRPSTGDGHGKISWVSVPGCGEVCGGGAEQPGS